jgi:hypothetical protein
VLAQFNRALICIYNLYYAYGGAFLQHALKPSHNMSSNKYRGDQVKCLDLIQPSPEYMSIPSYSMVTQMTNVHGNPTPIRRHCFLFD